MPRSTVSTTFERLFRRCWRSTTTPIASTPTPTTRPSRHQRRRVFAGLWLFSSSSIANGASPKTKTQTRAHLSSRALTDLVEEAVLQEFERLSDRGGVLGAMETVYQRGKIQEESLYYERKKHDGSYPIVGVNTFVNPDGEALPTPELIRSTEEETPRPNPPGSRIPRAQCRFGACDDKAPAGHSHQRRQSVRGPCRRGSGAVPWPDHSGPIRGGRPIPPEHVRIEKGRRGNENVTLSGYTLMTECEQERHQGENA